MTRQFDRVSTPHVWIVLALTITVFLGSGAPAAGDDGAAAPQRAYRFEDGKSSVSFPFEVYHGDIRFAAEINGRAVRLLLDDGFMWDPVLFWGGPDVDALGLTTDGETSIGDKDHEHSIEAETASGFSIRLPGIEFTDQTAVITPTSTGTYRMWAGSVGQVSGTFLKNLVVHINFDTMRITLSDPEAFEYPGKGVAVPWTPMEIGAWSIPGALVLGDGRRVELDFMMDLGYNDQAQIATRGDHRITVPQTAQPGVLGFNIQQEALLGHFGRLAGIEIGGFEVKDVLAAFVAEDQSDEVFHEVMIGLGLLSRFNLTFDFTRQRIFVEPNDSFADRFEQDMSGLSLGDADGESVGVLSVHAGSPAAAAGIEVGDRVLMINGRPATEYSYWDLQPLLETAGEKIEMVVTRRNQKLEVSFILRRVI
jgi:hypothetical protein